MTSSPSTVTLDLPVPPGRREPEPSAADRGPQAPESETERAGAVDRNLLEATLEYIRPALQADGGDLILNGVDADGTVDLQLVGACAGCPLSMMTLTAGIERILTERVPGVTSVRAA